MSDDTPRQLGNSKAVRFANREMCQEEKERSKKMTGNGRTRSDVRPGLEVEIVLKKDQRTGALTRGIVKDILTNSPTHPHGIKVRLQDGQVGRVKAIIGAEASSNDTGGNS